MRVRRSQLGICCGILLCLAPGAARAQMFAVTTFASPTPTASISAALLLSDGNQALTAPTFVTGLAGTEILRSLASNPLTGDVVSIATSVGGSQLVHVDLQHGTITPFGPPLTINLVSLAFNSKGQLFGFALCDTTYTNQLFQIDPASGDITGALGSLDAAQVGSCGTLALGAAIAIDPATDVLYLASVDAYGILFVDSFNSLLTPTTQYTDPVLIASVPTAATIVNGQIWIATTLTQFGPGAGFLTFSTTGSGSGTQLASGGASYRALSFKSNAPVYGLLAFHSACVPSANVACLYNRFKVEVTYDATPNSGTGPATVLLESQQSVKFSFFDPGNVEMILKILNACVAPYNKWWVSGAGLTNVGVSIAVTDTQTGKVKTYSNPKNQLFQTFFDTAAFDCP
jgi:hypothetical protein